MDRVAREGVEGTSLMISQEVEPRVVEHSPAGVVEDLAMRVQREDRGSDGGQVPRITSYNVCYTKLLRSMAKE